MADVRHVNFSPAGKPAVGSSSPLGWDVETPLLMASRRCQGDPAPILAALADSRQAPPTPGSGRTTALWEFLATLAGADLAAARTVEPHLDAAAILSQAGIGWQPGTTWGVFAAEGGPNKPATARQEAPGAAWTLDGRKPWCSLAGTLDHAVVTAHVDGGRRAFAVDLRQAGVTAHAGSWESHGLGRIPSEPVDFSGARAHPVGATNWYLDRPGFAVGGVGVAACWFGGAVGIYRTLFRSAQGREPDQLARAWLGEADRLLASGAALLREAARDADDGTLTWETAQRVRGHIAETCERLLVLAGRALGPAPLGFDRDHARRVADLGIYIRQHHSSRDDAALGGLLLEDANGGTGRW